MQNRRGAGVSFAMMIWSETAAGPVTVTVPDQAALLTDLDQCFAEGQGFSVATLNLDHAVKLARDPAFRAAYAAQSHITADGNPVMWLSRLAGQDVKLVPGADLVAPLTRLAAERGIPVAFFGATEASLQAAAGALRADAPGIEIVATLAPPMGFDPQSAEAEAAMAQLRDSGARLVFLALGAPKQEIFAARAHAALPGVGFVSIGAGLDFIAGTQTRAPAWVRKLAAEWLWRMLLSPKRLVGRYGACLLALPGLTWRAWMARRKGRAA